MADNLAKRGLLLLSPCLLCGANLETAGRIFLHCPFTSELWEPEKNPLALSSWPSIIANLWGDCRRSSIPHIETNHWYCVVNAII